ncbi:cytochrome P450 [Myxococcota bacterium]|nr:cytochrome P450 [Myxococcota bacterium]
MKSSDGSEVGSEVPPIWGIYEIARSPDPWARWAEIREHSPVLDVGEGLFFVTSWALVDQVVRDPDLLAGSGVARSMSGTGNLDYDPTQLWLMALDGTPHSRARGLVRREFTSSRVGMLLPFIEDNANRLVDAFFAGAASEPKDFVSHVAQRLPSEVIRHLFDIDSKVWETDAHGDLVSRDIDPAETIGSLARFFEAQCEIGGEGLLSKLRSPDESGAKLSLEEVVSNAVLLTTAAIDTTTGLIANALICLLRSPGVRERLCSNPSLIPAVVEETLRFEPPALSCSRYTRESMSLDGVEIPAGSHLLLGIGAANRDSAKYPNPNQFDPDRDHTGLLTFGGGRHFCLGATLARMEARAVLESMLSRIGSLTLVEPVDWRSSNPTVRVPRALWVRTTSG